MKHMRRTASRESGWARLLRSAATMESSCRRAASVPAAHSLAAWDPAAMTPNAPVLQYHHFASINIFSARSNLYEKIMSTTAWRFGTPPQ